MQCKFPGAVQAAKINDMETHANQLSDRIRNMRSVNGGYSADDLKNAEAVKDNLHAIAADIIALFPGEIEDDHEED